VQGDRSVFSAWASLATERRLAEKWTSPRPGRERLPCPKRRHLQLHSFPRSTSLTYQWDLDGNGIFGQTGGGTVSQEEKSRRHGHLGEAMFGRFQGVCPEWAESKKTLENKALSAILGGFGLL
jgi:hypothetical protein